MPKASLIIIFNHRYDDNIPILEKIYGDRFSSIWFLVPFYRGNHPRVIPVYESSYYFQSYFAQAYHRFANESCTHYIFLGDDCILNPSINETNFVSVTGLPEGANFIPGIFPLHHPLQKGWLHTCEGIDFYNNRKGAEIKNELPSRNEAMALFKKHGVEIEPLGFENIFKDLPNRDWKSKIYSRFAYHYKWKSFKKAGKIELPYPVAASYSDILFITRDTVEEFCRICGVLAAIGLFVELAIPTAAILTSSRIVEEGNLLLRGKAIWDEKEIEVFRNKFDLSLRMLIDQFPADQLYFHPVKISKWKQDL